MARNLNSGQENYLELSRDVESNGDLIILLSIL